MTSEEALILIVRMAAFKLLVRANLLGCDNDLARLAYDNVIDVRDAWRANLADHIDLICSVASETDTQKQDDLAHHLHQRDHALDRHWHLGEPYDVGGWLAILDDIAITCRLAIRPAMVFYKVTPMPASGRKAMMPFDPDAEIPW